MRAGELRDLVAYEKPTYVSDGAGGSVLVWVLHCKVWAKVKTGATTYGAGKELVKAEKLEPQKVYLFKQRYRMDIQENFRVSWKGKVLEITAILFPDSTNVEMQVLAKEVGINV